eukprot:scaffold1433_cov128-Skeletonema_dohrnii-CCMP3373.AAC.5
MPECHYHVIGWDIFFEKTFNQSSLPLISGGSSPPTAKQSHGFKSWCRFMSQYQYSSDVHLKKCANSIDNE